MKYVVSTIEVVTFARLYTIEAENEQEACQRFPEGHLLSEFVINSEAKEIVVEQQTF